MIAAHETGTVPLSTGEHGVVRVDGTRVTLDTVVAAFAKGASAEEIAHQYDVLRLADVYAVIAYYLRHKAHVDSYLAGQQALRHAVRQENAARLDPNGIRDRLLSRRLAE
jgi:uncharacterized protein (DUF433 family)